MKNETTLITAFFDIGRGKYNIQRCEKRTCKKYFDYFKFWCRVNNNLIVYTTSDFKDEIINIRNKYHKENKTTVIVIDNIFSIEQDIYNKMKEIENNQDFCNFRFWNIEVSNKADYDYIMMMKYWCMADAVSKNLIKTKDVTWIDFGFNHGGVCCTNPIEFDFTITTPETGKILLFHLPERDPKKTHSGLSLQFQFDSIMGAPVVCPKELVDKFYQLIRSSMISLLSLDCIDDDQQLLLMAYKKESKLFLIQSSDWFMPLKEYLGGEHLSTKDSIKYPPKQDFPFRKSLGKIRRFIFRSNKEKQKREFSKRMKHIASRWYN